MRGGAGLTGSGVGRGISAPDPDSLPACLFALRLSFSTNGAWHNLLRQNQKLKLKNMNRRRDFLKKLYMFCCESDSLRRRADAQNASV